MAESPIPPPVEELGDRPFSFFPPIHGIDHNEWRFLRSTWSEILVANSKTGGEIWLPRRYLGEISEVDQPVMIMGLKRELEYRGGVLVPHEKRVLTIPSASPPRPTGQGEPSAAATRAPRGSRASGTEVKIGAFIVAALVLAVLGTFLMVAISRPGPARPVASQSATDTRYLDLTRDDDYYASVRKLGEPEDDRWKLDTGELQYRVLDYSSRGYFVVLMGTEREQVHYIGTMSKNWQPIHYVSMPGGGDTGSLLRGLAAF